MSYCEQGMSGKATKRQGFRASVTLGTEACSGFLEKKASGALAGWQKRWFVAGGHYLRYYKDESKTGRLFEHHACLNGMHLIPDPWRRWAARGL